jgi:RES domain-containing protein
VIRAFRLSSSRFRSDSGAGAALHGGRWNPPGTEAIYSSSTASLAALEILVHFSVLPRDFVLTEIRIPERVFTETLHSSKLPAGWDSPEPAAATQEIGRDWLISRRTAVLLVPSAIVPSEQNLVLNPAHPQFRHIRFLAPKTFRFDPRLK